MFLKRVFRLIFLSSTFYFPLLSPAFAAPVVQVSPSTITSTQQTNIQLSISGITAGETAFVEQFVDVNQNGYVDSADTLVRSFHVTDGVRSTFNPNIQGDEDSSVNGVILTTINYYSLTELHSAGNYLFQATSEGLSSDATFTITPTATAQSVSGTITPESGDFPGAWVVLIDPLVDVIRASTFADANGDYQLYVPEAGSYMVGAITTRSGYYFDTSNFQAVTVVPGGQISGIDILLSTSGYTISGQIVDETNQSNGINGLQVEIAGADDSGNDIFAQTLTDEYGNFSITAPAGTYQGSVYGGHPENGAVQKGFIAYNDGDVLVVSDNITGIVGAVKPVTTYVSGQVINAQGSPVPGFVVSAENWGDVDVFRASAVTDENGNYTLGLIPSTNWHVEVSWDEDNEINYHYVGGSTQVDTTSGNVTGVDFVVRPATAWIQGTASYNSTRPVDDGWIGGSLSNWTFNHGTSTLETGFYRMPVFEGEWRVDAWPDGCMNAAYVEAGQTITLDVNYDGNLHGACDSDLDVDGILNDSDNCPATVNAGQEDVNGDGIGDACDTEDFDNDSLTDRQETILGTNPALEDTDGDGIPDGTDPHPLVPEGSSYVASHDLDADGDSDILLRNSTNGQWRMFTMENMAPVSQANLVLWANQNWVYQDMADYDADGDADVLLRNSTDGNWRLFTVQGGAVISNTAPNLWRNQDYIYQGSADFDADGDADILLRNTTTGFYRLFTVENGAITGSVTLSTLWRSATWNYAGAADFDNDGDADILLRNSDTGEWRAFTMENGNITGSHGFNLYKSLTWSIQGIADYDKDGDADVLMRDANGSWKIFAVQDGQVSSINAIYLWQNTAWVNQSAQHDLDGDGDADVLLRNSSTGQWRTFTIENLSVTGNGSPLIWANQDWQMQ